MRIDVVTPKNLAFTEDMMRDIANTLHDEMKKLRDIVMQLQDRIQIIETHWGKSHAGELNTGSVDTTPLFFTTNRNELSVIPSNEEDKKQ